jgi:multidrug resistance efflux pump
MNASTKTKSGSRTRLYRIGGGAAAAVLFLLVVWWMLGGPDPGSALASVPVQRGPLEITVLEGGTIEALESQVIRSEVRGETKILYIVDEGYLVTAEDVESEKILVQLDDASLQENLTAAEIEYQNAAALLTDAREQYEIQIKQNESDITAAELEAKFASMDFEKYLGAAQARSLVAGLGLVEIEATIREQTQRLAEEADEVLEEALAPPANTVPVVNDAFIAALAETLEGRGISIPRQRLRAMVHQAAPEVDGQRPLTDALRDQLTEYGVDTAALLARIPAEDPEPVEGAEEMIAQAALQESTFDRNYMRAREAVDFTRYADPDQLEDGQGKQNLRKLMDELLLAEEELGLARVRLDGTRRLAENDFVIQSELENDEMRVRRSEISVQAAETALDLYVRYEFPKSAEQLLSNYEEALRRLERVQKQAVSRLAQATSKLRSSEAQYQLRLDRRDELIAQIERCIIRAERTGLVIYGGADDRNRDIQIEEGASLRERQVIITIPDMTRMGLNVKIHESAVNRIRAGMPVTVRVDSFPDERLKGTVRRVAVLPDSQNRWLNPDLKVFTTIIAIEGQYEWLKPGTSASAEILVEEISDTTYIPIQAVKRHGDTPVVYVATAGGERRPVRTGSYNNDFIQVTEGLTEGERVYLRVPPQYRHDIPGETGPAPADLVPEEPLQELAQT